MADGLPETGYDGGNRHHAYATAAIDVLQGGPERSGDEVSLDDGIAEIGDPQLLWSRAVSLFDKRHFPCPRLHRSQFVQKWTQRAGSIGDLLLLGSRRIRVFI